MKIQQGVKFYESNHFGKPSVASSIAAVLNATKRQDGFFEENGYIVSWCAGHLLEHAAPEAYNEAYAKWQYSDLPIIPDNWKHVASKGKAAQLKILCELMKRADVECVINACDAGREGELIFRLAYNHAKCTKKIMRLWISSMEDAAIRDGFGRLKDGADYDSLYAAASCRERADWLVGLNMTRLFSVLYGVTLNTGRVQSPTLAMLVKREADISAFVKEPFYIPQINCGGFIALSEKLKDRQAAEAIRAACDRESVAVLSVERQKKTATPPKLYDLTTLQREANRLLGFTAQQTLDYAQSLYEKKICTYPRTDSRYLIGDMRDTAGALVTWLQVNMGYCNGASFAPDVTRLIRQSASQMRATAAAKKQQAAALKASAAALGAQISALHNAITTTKRYIENIISIVQRTDLTYAQQMDAIGAETQAFIAKINGIYNSFNDSFPLESKSLSSGTKGSNIASGQNDNLFMYIGSNYNSPSIVKDVLNKLLNMNPESVAKNKTAFYNGLPDDLKKQINISNLIATDDGFVLCTKPLNEIFNGLGYSKVNGLDVNNYYDDWYLYGISGQKKVTYSLLKMRELEHDPVDDIHDDNKAGTSIPFVSIDINLFQTNDEKLSNAIDNVTNASENVKSVAVDSDILNYFLNPEEKGSYVVAETSESALKNINSPVVLINAIDYVYLKHAISSDSGIEEEKIINNLVTAPYFYDDSAIVQEKKTSFGEI